MLRNFTPFAPIRLYDKKTIFFGEYEFEDSPIKKEDFNISKISGFEIRR